MLYKYRQTFMPGSWSCGDDNLIPFYYKVMEKGRRFWQLSGGSLAVSILHTSINLIKSEVLCSPTWKKPRLAFLIFLHGGISNQNQNLILQHDFFPYPLFSFLILFLMCHWKLGLDRLSNGPDSFFHYSEANRITASSRFRESGSSGSIDSSIIQQN